MMTEKEKFLITWEREFQTTIKLLKLYPADKGEFKPDAPKTRSAKELAWTFVQELKGGVLGAINGKIDFSNMPTMPATFSEVLDYYQTRFAEITAKIKAMSEADYNSQMEFPVGPNQMAQFRKADIFWMMLFDLIHHRGQFTIYNRMVGAKVPSIYGPSADEPWM